MARVSMIKRLPASHGQRGSVLVAIIFAMVIVAGLGAAMLTMFSTSTMNQFGAMDSFRAYYLAEAGGRYAIPIIKADINNPAALIAQLNKTYTLANGDRFQLNLSYTAPNYTLVSTGILSQGTQALSATRSVTYSFINPGSSGKNIPFNTATDLSANFTGYDPSKVQVVNNAQSNNSPALEVTGKSTALQLSWDGNPGLPDLAQVWFNNDGLLSYAIQVKIKLFPSTEKEYMAGLSFRVRGTPADTMYGLSFMKRNDCTKDLPSPLFCTDIPAGVNNLYIVLWKEIGGTYSVMDYRLATVTDGIVTGIGGDLNAWSTLVLKLEEQYVLDAHGNRVDANHDSFDDRKNLISAYIQGPAVYPRNKISWDYSNFKPVVWHAGNTNPIIDTSLTSEDFASRRPDEIGFHSFYPTLLAHRQFFDDFSISFVSSLRVVQH